MADILGVVCNRSLGGVVVRILNPDYEVQLDREVLAPGEYMIRVRKSDFGVSSAKDAMTPEQAARVVEVMGP
jgi:hypothetical protein